MNARARAGLIRLLTKVENRCRTVRRNLARSHRVAEIARPNDPEEWDRLYAAPVEPVSALTSEIATVLAGLSREGDVLLETGCGNARISAELATIGRKIQLADFSAKILERANKLFAQSGLPSPHTQLADLTRPLPWADRSVDITWSSGVLEHWTDEELRPIITEMARISRRRVVSLVPYAGSVFYRWGKWTAEQNGTWAFGRELPRQTLRPLFENAGLGNVTEYTVWPDVALEFLNAVDAQVLSDAKHWWSSLAKEDPLRTTQGYLLVTVGDIVVP